MNALILGYEMVETNLKGVKMINKYEGNDNFGKPKKEYVNMLMALIDDDLRSTTEDMIWLSAYASNNPRSDYHWQCDACYDEWVRRDKVEEYNKCWKKVSGN